MSRREVLLGNYLSLPYNDALNLQRRILAEKIERDFPDTLLLLEHPPVITLGRRGKMENRWKKALGKAAQVFLSGKEPHIDPRIRQLEAENRKLKEALALQTQELMLLKKEMNLV